MRLLEAGDTGEGDPNDARAVAVAALRCRAVREVSAHDHVTALKVRARRHRDLGRARNQVACRLHAVLCDLGSPPGWPAFAFSSRGTVRGPRWVLMLAHHVPVSPEAGPDWLAGMGLA